MDFVTQPVYYINGAYVPLEISFNVLNTLQILMSSHDMV